MSKCKVNVRPLKSGYLYLKHTKCIQGGLNNRIYESREPQARVKTCLIFKSNLDTSQKKTHSESKKKLECAKKNLVQDSLPAMPVYFFTLVNCWRVCLCVKNHGWEDRMSHARGHSHLGYVSGFASWVWCMSPNGLLFHATCINWNLFVKRRDNKKHRANYQVSRPWCSRAAMCPDRLVLRVVHLAEYWNLKWYPQDREVTV